MSRRASSSAFDSATSDWGEASASRREAASATRLFGAINNNKDGRVSRSSLSEGVISKEGLEELFEI